MKYEAILLIDLDKIQDIVEKKNPTPLRICLEEWIFGENYEKICIVKMHNMMFFELVSDPPALYELHFFKAVDATAFALIFHDAIYTYKT